MGKKLWEPLKAGLKYTYYGVNMVEIWQITIHGKVVTKDLKIQQTYLASQERQT